MSSKFNTTASGGVDREWQSAVDLALSTSEQDVERLRSQLEEMLHVNHLQDLHYREQQESFERYGKDVLRAQLDHQAIVAKLKAEKEEIRSKHDGLQLRYEDAASQVRVLSARMEELKEENELLRQQLKVYKEDFDAERRDRERIAREKETDKLLSNAGMTSLQLQLDRANSQLGRMKSESSRASLLNR